MNKSQTIKNAKHKTQKRNVMLTLKKILMLPIRLCRAIWNWLKQINIVGMVNLTLLVVIIVLFVSLISNVICCKKQQNVFVAKSGNVTVSSGSYVAKQDNRKVVQRKYNTIVPAKTDSETKITPKIKVVGVKKPIIDENISLPANELPKQNLYGDIIVDTYPGAVVLMNGVNVNGNLYVQNMRKYTLPCGAKISGNLFIRNVEKLSFCGAFVVQGNIYVTHRSSFGPIPQDAYVGGQVIL